MHVQYNTLVIKRARNYKPSLELYRARMSDGDKRLWVNVVGIKEKLIRIPIADTEDAFLKTTVTRLKQLIHDKWPEIDPDHLRLLFAGKQLADRTPNGRREQTFKDYSMQKDSTIHVVMRVYGGAQFIERVLQPPIPVEKHHE